MRSLCFTVYFLLCAVLAFGQRHKLSVDPETKEGYILQQIQQERDPAAKIKMMNDFVVEFPKSESLSWIYDQLQPVYMKTLDYDKVLAIGNRMLAADPADVDSAHNCLLAAEALNNPELVKKYATLAWEASSRAAKDPAYKKTDYALQVLAYSEYSIAALANKESDAQKRDDYMAYLAKINPASQWLHTSRNDFFSLTQKGATKEQLVAAAEKMLIADPNNEDMLLTVADYYMQRGSNHDKVIDYSSRIVETLRIKKRPDAISAAEWERKKERYLGAAYYMIGILSSIQGRYSVADKNLRAALPTIRGGTGQALGATLYHLGFANYQLAQKGERGRVFEAIKFNEQCAAFQSTYSDQAKKNIESIKSEYNLR